MIRGASESILNQIGAFTMKNQIVPPEAHHDLGKRAEKVDGWVGFPVTSPAGLVGVEFRNPCKKEVVKYYTSAAAWSATWIGTENYTQRCFNEAPLWIVEGVFDLFALSWSIKHPIVAASKAFLTKRQIDYIVRFSRNGVRLALDNDEYGKKSLYGDARSKGLLATLKQRGVKDVLPVAYSGKDPGEVWDRGGEFLVASQFDRWK